MAARPPRGLSSPVWSTDGLGPTLAGLEPCIGHHDYSFMSMSLCDFFSQQIRKSLGLLKCAGGSSFALK